MDLSKTGPIDQIFSPNDDLDLQEWRTTMQCVLHEHGVIESESLRREEWCCRYMMHRGRFEVKDQW